MKLKNQNHEDFSKRIQSLANNHFNSNFHIETGLNSEKIQKMNLKDKKYREITRIKKNSRKWTGKTTTI